MWCFYSTPHWRFTQSLGWSPDIQQLFNFEMLHATRAYDRGRKNNDNAESNPEDTTIEITNPPVTPPKGVAPDAPICDLPSDEDDPFKYFKDY